MDTENKYGEDLIFKSYLFGLVEYDKIGSISMVSLLGKVVYVKSYYYKELFGVM